MIILRYSVVPLLLTMSAYPMLDTPIELLYLISYLLGICHPTKLYPPLAITGTASILFALELTRYLLSLALTMADFIATYVCALAEPYPGYELSELLTLIFVPLLLSTLYIYLTDSTNHTGRIKIHTSLLMSELILVSYSTLFQPQLPLASLLYISHAFRL